MVLVCLSDVQHPRESSLYVRLMYDSSCCINRPSKRLFIFIFLLSCIDHRLLTFISVFHFFNLYLYIHIPIYISRHLLTTKMHIHTYTHVLYILFPTSKPLNIANKSQMQKQKKDAQYIFHIQNPVRAEVRTGLSFSSTRHIPYHRDHFKRNMQYENMKQK